MAYAKKTLANLKQSLADKHDAGVIPTDSATLSYWTRLLNEGLVYCVQELGLVKSTSLTTSSGTIVMPDDFSVIDKVVDADGVQLYQISKEDSAEAEGLAFWITGNHLEDFYLNTPSDETYTVWYKFHPAEMSSDSDECIIPDPEAVTQYAYSRLRTAETDPLDDAEKAMGDCIRRIRLMRSNMRMNDKDFSFMLPNQRPQTWWESL